MKCCVCNRPGDEKTLIPIVLTEGEKETIQKLGVVPEDVYHYCEPCHRTLRNREAGARLMQGTARSHLTAMGHPSPDQASEKVYETLVKGKR